MKLRGRIGLVGFGTMGSAIARGLLQARAAAPAQLIAWDPSPARLGLARRTIRAAGSTRELVRASRIVVLAVKPQEIGRVLEDMAPVMTRRPLVISIATGISTRRLEQGLGTGIPVVRVMPNTPAQIRQGVAVLCRGRWARPAHLAITRTMFEALGTTLELPERLFHAVTAVSGSGPAYVFFVMEAMLAAGCALGIPEPALRTMVSRTVAGSGALAARGTLRPDELRARVTSKGGTTAAAIQVFEARRVRQAMVAGIVAAAKRSVQLGA